MKKQESLARKECANYTNGNCLGVMFSRKGNKLTSRIDGKYAGKKCIVDTNNCSYFNQIVVRAMA
jgi:hypothetical protein|tara:strand:+ start:559 stop:753 length:195 start_codon:yes stop_codon:yes gene_type:complete